MIYLLKYSDSEFKIGFTDDFEKRLSQYRFYNPGCQVLKKRPGDKSLEKRLIKFFKPFVVRGKEWLFPDKRIIKYLDESYDWDRDESMNLSLLIDNEFTFYQEYINHKDLISIKSRLLKKGCSIEDIRQWIQIKENPTPWNIFCLNIRNYSIQEDLVKYASGLYYKKKYLS